MWRGLQSLCFYQNPEETSSPGAACFWRSFRPSGPWCFAVSRPPARTLLWSCFEGMGAALWSWFLVGSEGTVRHQQQQPQQHHQQQQQAQQLQAAGPAAAITLCFYQNPEGTSSPGTAFFGGRSVLQGHGVLLFRNRPLGLCCGAALRAWELHFGAGFLLVQKATLGTSSSSSNSRPSS